ncbi:hypothetical protein KCU77_g731, partial [Aureobasidium melanogenum]
MAHINLERDELPVQPGAEKHMGSLTDHGREVYLEWSTQQKLPHLRAINGIAGDILDDVIDCYRAAQKMAASLLCDHILDEACKIGKTTDLVLAQTHIDTAYFGLPITKGTTEGPLCHFHTAITTYYERELPPGTLKAPTWLARPVYLDLPAQFRFDLFMMQSESIMTQNPCSTPEKFMTRAQHIIQTERLPAEEDAAGNA